MAPALFDQVRVRINAGDYSVKATGSSLLFPGYLMLYRADGRDTDTMCFRTRRRPKAGIGRSCCRSSISPSRRPVIMKPPWSKLRRKGIGRPSTYVPIIETIQSRGYVLKENKAFFPLSWVMWWWSC
jgi:DNA topoisomerase I